MEAVCMGAVAREEVGFRIALLYLYLLYYFFVFVFVLFNLYFHLLEGILHQLPDQHGWLCHHWNHKVWLTISHHFFHLTMFHNFWQHLTVYLTVFDNSCQYLTVFDNFCQSLASFDIFFANNWQWSTIPQNFQSACWSKSVQTIWGVQSSADCGNAISWSWKSDFLSIGRFVDVMIKMETLSVWCQDKNENFSILL